MTCDFTSFSNVFQSLFQDDERVIIKDEMICAVELFIVGRMLHPVDSNQDC